MARVNVFLKDEVLKAADHEAKRLGVTRSALIQTALTEYLKAQLRARQEIEARHRMDKACNKDRFDRPEAWGMGPCRDH